MKAGKTSTERGGVGRGTVARLAVSNCSSYSTLPRPTWSETCVPFLSTGALLISQASRLFSRHPILKSYHFSRYPIFNSFLYFRWSSYSLLMIGSLLYLFSQLISNTLNWPVIHFWNLSFPRRTYSTVPQQLISYDSPIKRTQLSFKTPFPYNSPYPSPW